MNRSPEASTLYGLVGQSDDLYDPSDTYIAPALPEVSANQYLYDLGVPRDIARVSFGSPIAETDGDVQE